MALRAVNANTAPSGDKIAPGPELVTSDTSAPSSTLRRSGLAGWGRLRPGAPKLATNANASAADSAQGMARFEIALGRAAVGPGPTWLLGGSASGCAMTSSIATRASPMSRRRRLASFIRQRRNSSRIRHGVFSSRVPKSGSRSITCASVSWSVSPA